MKVLKPLLAVVAVFAVVVALFVIVFGTKTSTSPNQIGLWYKNGVFQSKKFDHVVDPGTRELCCALADDVFKYPTDGTTYEFSKSQDADTSPVTALSKDNVELTTVGVLSTRLNTDEKVLRSFHERIGLKYNAEMDGDDLSEGWTNMQRVYFRNALERAVNDASAQFTWKELYANQASRKKWESAVNAALPAYVKQSMRGDYFEDFSLTIQKPRLPRDLVNALNATQTAIEQNTAQQARNVQVQSELKAIKELVAVLGPDGYNTYQAIKDGKVTIIPVPQGTNINVPGR